MFGTLKGRVGLISIVLLAGILSGCAAKDEDSQDKVVAPTATFTEETGAIQGFVVNEYVEPVAGAAIGVRKLDAGASEFLSQVESDVEGRFAFSELEPGTYLVVVQRLGFEDAARTADVTAGQSTDLGEIKLAQIITKEAYSIVLSQRGIFGCGLSVRPVVGVAVCGIVGDVGELVGVNTTGYDRFLIAWPFENVPVEDWDASVFEMKWTTNQVLGRGLTMIWETPNCFNEGAKCEFARASGTSPLRVYTPAKKVQSTLEAAEACEESNCTLWSRVFAAAETLGAGSPADVGMTFQQPFEQYLSAYFYGPAPEDFTAIVE